MPSLRINKTIPERCLLTEVAPYETPSLFSFWGAYNYIHTLDTAPPPPYLKALLTPQPKDESIPFRYRIKKGTDSTRLLSLIHPKHAAGITSFYRSFDVYITKACRRSPFSLRAPHDIASTFRVKESDEDELREIEEVTSERIYASSYFKYNRFSYLYRFFDSNEYADLEKTYAKFVHLDIHSCFDSIYTHTISWAIRGRRTAKAQRNAHPKGSEPFDVAFDKLLQAINYQETNGIPIGPELSRIFAEVILQKIDLNVIERLRAKGLEVDIDYCCRRYVDDIFFFFNIDGLEKTFTTIFEEELSTYKLHLNADKMVIRNRPFITSESLAKLKLSEFISGLWARLDRLRTRDSSKEIARLRANCPFADVGFHTLAGFFFASVKRGLLSHTISKLDNLGDVLYVISDLAFHAFRMDTSASASYKVTDLVLTILSLSQQISESDKAKLSDKIIYELRGAILGAISRGHHVEAINALIVLREMPVESALSREFIQEMFVHAKKAHRDELGGVTRLNYFCIVGLLYAIGDRSEFSDVRDELVLAAEAIISQFNPNEYAESVFLLLDLTSCPFLSPDAKSRLIKIGMVRHKPTATSTDVGQFRNFVSHETWFFNWNKDNNLKMYLRKKQLSPAY